MTILKLFLLSLVLLLTHQALPQQEDQNWKTVFEKSGFISTADYDQTMNCFQSFADNSEFAEFLTFGISPQGRELKYLVVSKDKFFNAAELKAANKPLLFVINGIHSGEIEGKDASMILLREILVTKEKEYLLDSINIIVVPIFSVDGHERKSKYNRINQNGPEEMGWRTTAQNLNLNRDWMKADAPEMQAMIKLVNEWDPDFVIDTHTTNGADYQYTVTYSVEWSKNMFKQSADWLGEKFVPFLENRVEEKGFLIYPYVYLKNWDKGLDEGLIYWPSTPRFSSGYFALQNRPMLLVETHMLKPYKERVYSTKAVLETTMEFVFNNSTELKELNRKADKETAKLCSECKYLPISFSNTDNYELMNFKGYEYYWDASAVSGTNRLIYTNNKKDFKVKYFTDVFVKDSVNVAKGYYIPPEYSYLVNRISLHGIELGSIVRRDSVVTVTKYKFKEVKYEPTSYEGRQRVSFVCDTYTEEVKIPAGSFYYSTDSRTARVLTHLLEPKSSDSFVQWGFMNQIFEQKEYYEDYVMEKLAEEMLENDPELKKEFEEKLETDEAFRNNSSARLDFFYERSPYPDKQLNVYPLLRVE
ncbi:MAG TPA: M14 family metallopeptidase [Ignavibacteriaceae bacterium]|nr:M14 family metallopeptidase [Ignavibacteriaceae bacterium]